MAGSIRCALVTAAAVAAFFLVADRLPASPSRPAPAAPGPQEPEAEAAISWQAIEARAVLDGNGVLRVTERLALAVSGPIVTVGRMFRSWLTSEVAVTSVARLDPSTGARRPLARGTLDTVDRYEFADAMLHWTVRRSDDRAFDRETTLSYEIDYVVTGSVIPIWGVRAFGSPAVLSTFILLHPLKRASELWEAWRLAPGGWTDRYLLDFDFSPFPFNASAPIGRFSLDLRFDPAWRPLAQPRPLRTAVAAGEDLRDLVPLDYATSATPAGVHRMRHAVWLAPLILGPAGVIALGASRIARLRAQKRRLDRTAVDEAWIRQHVLSRAPSDIRRLAAETDGGANTRFFGAPATLEHMERDGKIALVGPPEAGTLRLRAGSEAPAPAEGAILDALFAGSDTVTAEDVRRRIGYEGLDLDRVARKALDAAQGVRPSATARVRRAASPILIGLGVVLTVSVLETGGFFALATALVVGSFVSQIAGLGLGGFARSSDLPLWRIALLALPAVVFPVGEVGFFLMMPAHPLAVLGQALLWLGLMNAMVNSTRSRWTDAEVDLRYGLARARRYVAAELEKKRPELDDAWLPWILALGLQDEVETWRRGRGMFATRSPEPGAAPAARWTGGIEGPPVTSGWAKRFLYGVGT